MNNAQQWVALVGGGISLPLILALISAIKGNNQDKVKREVEQRDHQQSSAFREVELNLQTLGVMRDEMRAIRGEQAEQKAELVALREQARANEEEIKRLKTENLNLRRENVVLRARLDTYEGRQRGE